MAWAKRDLESRESALMGAIAGGFTGEEPCTEFKAVSLAWNADRIGVASCSDTNCLPCLE